MKFSAPDNDNNQYGGNCAAGNSDGWWYSYSCAHIYPNSQPPLVYFNSKGYFLSSIEIKIRQHDCII